MQKIIDELEQALKNGGSLLAKLQESSSLYWQEEYPVAVVHEKVRIKEVKTLKLMEERGYFDTEDKTAHTYTEKDIEFLKTEAGDYVKTVSLLGKKKEQEEGYVFAEKYPHDYWKKIENRSEFQVVVERSKYDKETLCEIEANLRDIMRSSKEVPSVKAIGFIWIAKVPRETELEKILKHYFLRNYLSIESGENKIYMGWSPTLKEVNMRYFVCPPL